MSDDDPYRGLSLVERMRRRQVDPDRAEKQRRWREENREAIEAFNRYIELHGSAADAYNPFWTSRRKTKEAS